MTFYRISLFACCFFLIPLHKATAYTTTFKKYIYIWKTGIQCFCISTYHRMQAARTFHTGMLWPVLHQKHTVAKRAASSKHNHELPWRNQGHLSPIHTETDGKRGGKKESQGSCPSWLGGRVWDNSTKSSSHFNAGLVRTVRSQVSECLIRRIMKGQKDL